MSGKTDGALPFIPHHCRITARWHRARGGASETFRFFRFGVSESVKSNVNHGIIGKLGTFRDLLTLFRVTWRFSLFPSHPRPSFFGQLGAFSHKSETFCLFSSSGLFALFRYLCAFFLFRNFEISSFSFSVETNAFLRKKATEN